MRWLTMAKSSLSNKRVNEKKTLLGNTNKDKLELIEKMNDDIDMAAGPADASEGED